MKLPKLDNIVRLMKSLDELYCMYRLDSGLGFTLLEGTLSNGLINYKISSNSNISYIDIMGNGFEGLSELLFFYEDIGPFCTEIRNDNIAIFPTRWPYDDNIIRRKHHENSFHIVDSYNSLPKNQSLEPDMIEPIIFQNLTRYTMNEVLTQMIALQVYPNIDSDNKSTMKINYAVLELLSEEEIDEINDYIQTEISERAESANL